MQFCWLQPEQRPTAEEVHLLLSYLTVKGASELEEEFEKRWNSMKPAGGAGSNVHLEAEISSYPLLEHFSDGFHSDGDDVLTVTQTSQGLNFEYKWERGKHEQYPLNPGCSPYQDMYFTPSAGDRLSLGVSPSCYENKEGIPGTCPLEVVPVLSAHSPSVAGDYYIRIEEPLCSSVHQDCGLLYGETCTGEMENSEHLSDNSPTVSLTMEPLVIESTWSDKEDRELTSQAVGSECCHSDSTAENNPLQECGLEGFRDPLGASPSLKQLCQACLGSEKSEDRRTDSCQIQLDSVTLKLESQREKQQYDHFQGDLPAGTSCLTAFTPHWASNISSNNNISTTPLDSSSASWCNRRAGESHRVEIEPYGPESWQNMESGEGESDSFLLELEDQLKYSNKLSSPLDCGEENTDSPEQKSDSSPRLSPAIHPEENLSELNVGHKQYKETVFSPVVCTANEERDFEQEANLLSANMIGVVSTPPELKPTLDILNDVSGAVSHCSLVLPEDLDTADISPSKAKDSPEELFPLELYQSDSDLEDTMEITSGVFTDLSSERCDIVQPFRSLQKQAGTPDSLDSLDMPSTASSCDAFSLGTYASCGQHKALDSGYDTENYESPEFVLKEPPDNRDTDTYFQLNQSNETVLGPGDMHMSRSVSSDLQSLDAKNPYRDSAYFSDYDSFTREEDVDQVIEGEPKETNLLEVLDSSLEKSFDGLSAPDISVTDEGPSLTEHPSPLSSPPLPKDCNFVHSQPMMRQDSVDEGLGLECQKDHSLQKPSPLLPIVEAAPHRIFTLSPVQLCISNECNIKQGAACSITLTTGLQMEEKEFSCNRETGGNHHLTKCLSPPLHRKDGKGGESVDEEDDEESEDSDESDEELRCYNIQEHSEESEEEHGAVPIVITESGSSGNLRSLLKIPNFFSETECTELDRKKKAVSFFDDVTVYLFDQESPTRELTDQELSGLAQSNGTDTAQEEGKQGASYMAETGFLLKDSGGFRLEDDLDVTKVKPSFATSLSPELVKAETNSLPVPIPMKSSLPVQHSRFSVSPTSLSRFSITQVADSDVKSVGGNREPGERV